MLDTMAERLAAAFERLGARVMAIDAEFVHERRTDEDVVRDIRMFSPGLIVGMNLGGVAPVSGRWFPEHFDAPFLSWLVDHPAYFMSAQSPLYRLRASPEYYIGCVDPLHLNFLERFYPSDRLLFLPHAGEPAQQNPIRFGDREPAAVLTAGLGRAIPKSAVSRDMESADESGSWFRRAYRIVHDSTLMDVGLDVLHQIEGQMRLPASDRLDVLAYSIAAFQEIESRLRQEIRRTLLARVADAEICRLDVYGDASWKDFARPDGSVRYLGELDYPSVRPVFARYQYVLNPQPPQTRNGSHERVMDALSAGTLPMTLTNEFYRESFSNDIVHLRLLDDGVEANLADDHDYPSRLAAAQSAFERNHTWTARARMLLDRFCGEERSVA